MKKLLLLIMMLVMSVIGTAAKKTLNKSFEGQYVRSTNTFTYVKDNLVFPNKTINYTVKDDSGLLDQIYNFIGQKYGVTDTDVVVLDIEGTASNKNKIMTIKKITNYQIPEDRLHPSVFGLPSSSINTETTNDNTAGVSNNETETPNTPNLNNTGSFFNQEN